MEEPRIPNRFSKQGHPLSLGFYFCEIEIMFYGFKSLFEGEEPMQTTILTYAVWILLSQGETENGNEKKKTTIMIFIVSIQ